jgi:hypothetical protein
VAGKIFPPGPSIGCNLVMDRNPAATPLIADNRASKFNSDIKNLL